MGSQLDTKADVLISHRDIRCDRKRKAGEHEQNRCGYGVSIFHKLNTDRDRHLFQRIDRTFRRHNAPDEANCRCAESHFQRLVERARNLGGDAQVNRDSAFDGKRIRDRLESRLTNAVATPLWGVCIFGAARSGRRTAPWLQRAQIYRQLPACVTLFS